MFASPDPARNEFVEPPPQDQSAATLVLNRQRLACRLVEVSIGGFSVMVPRATSWTGEPVARLVTQDCSYNVRILKQEARYDGFQVTLQRIDEAAGEELTAPQRWIIYGSRCCAIGLILAIAWSLVAAPGGPSRTPARSVGLTDLVNFWFDRTPAAKPAARPAPSNGENGEPLEMPAIPVSLGTVAAAASAELDRNSLLRSALAAADAQRSRPMNAATVPWLFPDGASSPRCRMCRSAENDLRMFAAGLKSLPAAAAGDAVESLHDAIAGLVTAPASAVDGFPQVRRTRCEDADLYFRIVDGEAELLRVLPIELDDSAPRRAPSAASGYSIHR